MIKAVLFDVDGVLYDSMPAHAESWQAAFKLISLRLPVVKEVYLQEGRPDQEFVETVLRKHKIKSVSKYTIQEMINKKVKEFDSHPKPPVILGAKQFMAQIRRQGKKVGIVTGSSQPKTLKRLKQDFGIERKSVVTGSEVVWGKPHPEPFLKAAKKLGVKPDECLVIENAPLGVQSARRAGMEYVALNTGMLSDNILRKAGAKRVYKSYVSLIRDF